MKSPVLIQENVGDLPIATRSYIDYLTVNTLFNIKASIRRETYYVGVGPRLDFNMGNHTVADGPVEDLDLIGMKGGQAVVFGLKCEAGFWYDLSERYRVGANLWLGANSALQSFRTSYNINNPLLWLILIVVTAGIIAATIGYRLYKIARTNPAETIKAE